MVAGAAFLALPAGVVGVGVLGVVGWAGLCSVKIAARWSKSLHAIDRHHGAGNKSTLGQPQEGTTNVKSEWTRVEAYERWSPSQGRTGGAQDAQTTKGRQSTRTSQKRHQGAGDEPARA